MTTKMYRYQFSDEISENTSNYFNLKKLLNSFSGYYFNSTSRMEAYIDDKLLYTKSFDHYFDLEVFYNSELAELQDLQTRNTHLLTKNISYKGGWVLLLALLGGLILVPISIMTGLKKYIIYSFFRDLVTINISLLLFIVAVFFILYAICKLCQRDVYFKRQKVFTEIISLLNNQIYKIQQSNSCNLLLSEDEIISTQISSEIDKVKLVETEIKVRTVYGENPSISQSDLLICLIINKLLQKNIIYADYETNPICKKIKQLSIDDYNLFEMFAKENISDKAIAEILAFVFYDEKNSIRKKKLKRSTAIFSFKVKQKDVALEILSCFSDPQEEKINSFKSQFNTAINLSEANFVKLLGDKSHPFNLTYDKIVLYTADSKGIN